MSIPRLLWRSSLRNSLSRSQRRWVSQTHQYPELPGSIQVPSLLDPHDGPLVEKGIDGIYTPIGFKYAWSDYQSHILTEVNRRYKDRIPASSKAETLIRNIIVTHKNNPNQAALYNYASMAFNNLFFFQGMLYGIPGIDPPSGIPQGLKEALERDFFSIENLRAEFLANANSMFLPGFVWLVYTTEGYSHTGDPHAREFKRFLILRTYGAGSPLIKSQFKSQLAEGHIRFDTPAAKTVAERIAKDATLDVTPLMCVSTWQHSYIPDWTVSGKEKYLEAWWDRINWQRVADISNVEVVSAQARSRVLQQWNERTGRPVFVPEGQAGAA